MESRHQRNLTTWLTTTKLFDQSEGGALEDFLSPSMDFRCHSPSDDLLIERTPAEITAKHPESTRCAFDGPQPFYRKWHASVPVYTPATPPRRPIPMNPAPKGFSTSPGLKPSPFFQCLSLECCKYAYAFVIASQALYCVFHLVFFQRLRLFFGCLIASLL